MNELIIKTICNAIPNSQVFVDSPDGTHFQAVVVSEAFVGMALVRQHQAVMNALRSEFDSNRVHAMQLKTMTPEQYEKATGRPVSST